MYFRNSLSEGVSRQKDSHSGSDYFLFRQSGLRTVVFVGFLIISDYKQGERKSTPPQIRLRDMMEKCLVCERIIWIKQGKNPYFVKELKTGYVVLGDFQFYHGYTLFLSKIHTDELHKLGEPQRTEFLKDMAVVAEAVYKSFSPKKLNYELLGNTDAHLHWHLLPRYNNDPKPETSTWVTDKKIRYDESAKPTEQELVLLKAQLLRTLNKLLI